MTYRLPVRLAFIWVFLLALPTQAANAQESLPAEEIAAIEEAVWKAVDTRNATWVDNDMEGHMNLYHPDFRRWTMYTRTLMNRDEFAELLWGHFKRNETVKSIEVVPEEITVLDRGSVAIAHYLINEEWVWTGEDSVVEGVVVQKGQMMQGSLRFSDVWVNQGGRWLYVGGHRDKMYLK